MLEQKIKAWGKALGFAHIGIAKAQPPVAEAELADWLAAGYHGDMDYMSAHGQKRTRPELLEANTLSVISARLDYQHDNSDNMANLLNIPQQAYVSRYALGRDYHKLIRKRLQQLAQQIEAIQPCGWRVFSDSAPVMEKPLAVRAGLGWQGKHSNLIARDGGSWFFLGEIYISLDLSADTEEANHCGHCQACIDVCPTQAIVAPYRVDARRCISYLTIENKTTIPLEFRTAIGNRIYGCDDCQLICPWNRFAKKSQIADFKARQNLDNSSLLDLFAWTESEFLQRLQGSPIRRIGHAAWLRNIAVALGNGFARPEYIAALQARADHSDPMVREHIHWALAQHRRGIFHY